MNRVISWLQSVTLRVIVTIAIVGFALLFDAAFGYGNQMQALADKGLTPEASSYQVDRTNSSSENTATEPVENSQNNLKGIADSIREKLNLDEPTPSSTKKFFKQVQGKDANVVEPKTGDSFDNDR
jgi:hypothetical protein